MKLNMVIHCIMLFGVLKSNMMICCITLFGCSSPRKEESIGTLYFSIPTEEMTHKKQYYIINFTTFHSINNLKKNT
jgi:hypothetical protein